MRRGRLAVTTLTALVLLVGCTASPAGDQPSVTSPATGSPPRSTATLSATPSPSPSPSAEPSPTATLPSREADSATARKALVTAADLGRPWVQADSPSDKACPGTRSAVGRLAFRATARRDLTRGAGELIHGATFQLATLPGPNAAKVRAAWENDTRACRRYSDQDDYYVVFRVAGPTSVRGADEILLRRVERVYFDRGDDEPAYARHTLVARRGRVVTTVTYSFLISEADPEASDFGRATELLQTQVAKATKAFGE